jgi:hypothetical protein
LDEIEARDGNDLLLYRGVRFAPDNEQLDLLTQAPLTGIRADRGGQRFSVTLDGRAAEDPVEGRTRILSGIRYRALTAGRRRVRCAVDTYLRPGDVADLGAGETLVAGEITITVTATDAVMEVAEAGA